MDEKLNEELAEYQESKSLKELEDLMEIIRAVVHARSWTLEQLELHRANKDAFFYHYNIPAILAKEEIYFTIGLRQLSCASQCTNWQMNHLKEYIAMLQEIA